MPVKREDSDGQEDATSGGQWAQGLSKGVYVHKASKRASKRAAASPARGRKPKRARGLELGESRMRLGEALASRSEIRVEERVESYFDLVEEVEETVQELQEEVFTGVFDSMVTFVAGAAAHTSVTIPTAVLLTGVNMPDHVSLFQLLTTKLEQVFFCFFSQTSCFFSYFYLRCLLT